MTKRHSIFEDEELAYIFRQLGIGIALGTAFLLTVYLGGIFAHLCSGM